MGFIEKVVQQPQRGEAASGHLGIRDDSALEEGRLIERSELAQNAMICVPGTEFSEGGVLKESGRFCTVGGVIENGHDLLHLGCAGALGI